MTGRVRRAGAFAFVGSLSLAAPFLGPAAFVPFATVGLLAALVIDGGPVFDLFARPGDHEDHTLYGLAGFSLAATGLALLVIVGFPPELFAGTVCLLAGGNLLQQTVVARRTDDLASAVGFVAGGFLAGTAAQLLVTPFSLGVAPASAAFLAACGALIGSLLRSVLYQRDDPLVLLSVGLVLWVIADLGIETTPTEIALAIAVTALLGYVSYALGTASVPGMVTGMLLGLVTIVLGGYAWFVLLIAFFAIGGLSSKFRYDRKRARGVAEDNDGARGSGNVLGNSAVALVAVLGYAATPDPLSVPPGVFFFAFAGSIATAMADTLSSEIGGVYDGPRLVTTGERVPPGTDGAVTWQGELAGFVGAIAVAGPAFVLFDVISPLGAALIATGGVAGMTADSLLGATVENRWLDNQGVNFLATLVGALVAVALAALAGLF
ncbi:hypothetical protein HAPAU_14770 [Halalkalicoccus paucihalophilus]|uniref:Cytidylyltransferase family protein n=1 Tax=Halalkalicoccus paucihalophilus TaxID=1008153 RepID=A0A151AFE9_9EURY|nr:DUF92 domain-containing protein [Halalkalicoccus paucihalophilus]KYH26379.1 hypothetical protein HAPAU_14770 [Halalkalicoccus paucihalophilus]